MRSRLKSIMKGAFLCTMTAMIFGCASTATTIMARQDGVGDAHVWPAYDPDIDYQFNEEAPKVQPPTKILDDCENVVETITKPSDEFGFGAPWKGFQELEPGTLVGRDRVTEIRVSRPCYAVLPNEDVEIGEDVIYLAVDT